MCSSAEAQPGYWHIPVKCLMAVMLNKRGLRLPGESSPAAARRIPVCLFVCSSLSCCLALSDDQTVWLSQRALPAPCSVHRCLLLTSTIVSVEGSPKQSLDFPDTAWQAQVNVPLIILPCKATTAAMMHELLTVILIGFAAWLQFPEGGGPQQGCWANPHAPWLSSWNCCCGCWWGTCVR